MSRVRAERLRKFFGGLAALLDVTLEVAPGERRAIIGPNGAGKTTLFNLITGASPPTAGRVFLDERDITAWPVHARVNSGLGQTFQRNNLFMGLTTFENIRLAVQQRHGVARQLFRPAHKLETVNRACEELLERVGLAGQADQSVSRLAYGQQRALEVALALAIEPRVLLLDEPTAGMSPAETAELVRLLEALPRTLTLLIVEHDMDVVFSLADRITVLHHGQVIAEGAPAEVRANALVQEIYLGIGSEFSAVHSPPLV
ncbi:MAG TPA: ABC transporter ATP-binding protein [Anaerolineae bacterium]|nr:ABC transporter ATP-binding protein [Anaerolineae bacterium]